MVGMGVGVFHLLLTEISSLWVSVPFLLPSCSRPGRWIDPGIPGEGISIWSTVKFMVKAEDGWWKMSLGGGCLDVWRDQRQNLEPMSLSRLWELMMDREACHAAVHGVAKSGT